MALVFRSATVMVRSRRTSVRGPYGFRLARSCGVAGSSRLACSCCRFPCPRAASDPGDIVLHDGEPKGSRVSNVREYSVFNVIDRWEESSIPTVEVIVRAGDVAVAELLALLGDRSVPAENWTKSIDIRCRACSEGRVRLRQCGSQPCAANPERRDPNRIQRSVERSARCWGQLGFES
jgi:hypothetical protein